MGYSTLKAALDAVVKSNGRQQITGSNLNGVMTSILQGVDIMDRANPADTSGMNHIVLKSNKTFAEQVTETNTIYEIRDSFNLNAATINIPNGCILVFKGGKISNGTLNGGDFNIVADLEKIFDGITFTGGCINNTYELDWFVGNKNSSLLLDGTQKNSTAEVQAAFNSGVMNIHISNRYFYYITSKLILKSWVSLVGDVVSFCQFRGSEQGEPCFYTDQTITILEVLSESDNNTKIQKEIVLDNVHLRHYGAIANQDYHMDIPILHITNGTGQNPNTWGVYLNVFVFFADRNIAELGKYMNGYTGIEIHANGGYFTYVNIRGRVVGCRRAFYLHATNPSWMTDVRIDADTSCVYGGIIDASPVRITGSHQTKVQLTQAEVNENPYYFKVKKGVSTGMIWDTNTSEVTGGVTYYNVIYSFFANDTAFEDLVTNNEIINPETAVIPPGNDERRWMKEVSWKFLSVCSNFLEKIFNSVVGWQLQTNFNGGLVVNRATAERGYLESLRAYDNNGGYVDLGEGDIKNYYKLFNLGGRIAINDNVKNIISDTCTLNENVTSGGYYKTEAAFKFRKNYTLSQITSGCYLVARMNYGSSADINKVYVILEFLDSTDNILESKTIQLFPTDGVYRTRVYLRYFDFPDSSTAYTHVRFRFRDDRSKNTLTPIAKFGIVDAVSLDNAITASGGEVNGQLVVRHLKYDLAQNNNIGCRYVHNKFINKLFTIGTSSYKAILNISVNYMRDAYVTLVDESGGVSVVKITKTSVSCSDKSINCKLDVHTANGDGRYLLSLKAVGTSRVIYVSSVYAVAAVMFVDETETHESGYFDGTYYADAIPTSGATSARPASPATGQTFFDTTLGKMIVYNGTAWVNMDGTPLA